MLDKEELNVDPHPTKPGRNGKAPKQAKVGKRLPGLAGDEQQDGGVFLLPKLNLQTIDVTLVGDTQLIMHQWSKKAREEMLAKQMKKARQGKEAKDPQKDFEEATYRHNGKYAFPAIAFKSAAVTACTSIGGVTKVQARQAFRVEGEFVIIEGDEPIMREDMVRVGMGTADLRYRPGFPVWWTTIRVSFNANVMSAEQILNMLNTAGFGVGIGDWRPEKNGQYGCFHVANDQEMVDIAKWRKDGVPKASRRPTTTQGSRKAAQRKSY